MNAGYGGRFEASGAFLYTSALFVVLRERAVTDAAYGIGFTGHGAAGRAMPRGLICILVHRVLAAAPQKQQARGYCDYLPIGL
ncbi:hypothetical protein BA177_16025 [Woeseia oceani]|uniref:Uncharacterized protein n=1 Tax=Woeseia oceani TaxID=1548547 RepID=A0A193LJ59_9GAMM|nr:hypothetical protein BA177_16025 [Woeseia oceani]